MNQKERYERSGQHEIAEPLSREVTLPDGGMPPLKYIKPDASRVARSVALEGPQEVVPATKPVAVLVAHGMGQQVKFQTLDQVEQGLRRIEEQVTGIPPTQQPPSRARVVKYEGEVLERLELSLTNRDDKSTTEVHLFEGYWAPLTEGRVGLRDVVSFLFQGGVNGYRLSRGNFQRWVFGKRHDFEVAANTARHLLLAVSVLLALIFLNAIVTLAWAALLAPAGGGGRVTPELLRDLTVAVAVLLVVATSSVALMYYSKRMIFFFLALGAIVATAGVVLLVILPLHLFGRHLSPEWVFAFGRGGGWAGRLATFLQVFVWALLVAGSWLVRRLLVQYVGDVAAYVSPHRLDRFDQIRSEVKNCVGRVADAIYAGRVQGRLEYDHIALVGHSLGSVVAYDTLNGLINMDRLSGNRLSIVDRTCLLLTFGSPLDKTAFVFATQSSKTTDSREALAAARQPMIEDYTAFRSFPWINIFSRKDIFSGSLDFYDTPPSMPPPPPPGLQVKNWADPEADRPVFAHIQYWNNPLVFDHLHRVITACGKPRGPAPAPLPEEARPSSFD